LIYVTEQPNDADLVKELGSMAIAAPIPHGDIIFFGVWEDDDYNVVPIRVCNERKKIGDMASCIITGRYLAQAQAAHEAGMDQLILTVEGSIRPGINGELESGRWRYTNGKAKYVWESVVPDIQYSRFDQYLTEVCLYLGVMVKRSADVKETAAQVKATWLQFQKPPSSHSSLKSIYSMAIPHVEFLNRPSLVRRMAKEIQGIGWERSGDVDKRFKTVLEMVSASEKDWMDIPGIGKKTAGGAVSSLNGLAVCHLAKE